MSDGVREAEDAKRRLGVVLYNDFELLDAYGPLEMFGCLGEALEIVVIAEQKGPVKSSGGPKTLAEFDFSDAPELDLLLLPGGITGRTACHLKQDVFFPRHLSERCGAVAGSRPLGGCGMLCDIIRRFRGNGHGPGGDRAALWRGGCGDRGQFYGVSVAP